MGLGTVWSSCHQKSLLNALAPKTWVTRDALSLRPSNIPLDRGKQKCFISAQCREGMKLPSLPLWSRIMHIIHLTTSGEKNRSSQEADRTKCWSSLEKSNRKSQLMMFYFLQQQDSTHAGFQVQEPSRPPVLELLKSKLQDAQPSHKFVP